MTAPEDETLSVASQRSTTFRHLDIEMLHDLLLEWCSDHNLNPAGADAHEVAHELADLFDGGIRDYLALREAIDSR